MAVAEQAPALDVEETEEKKKVTAEDDFEERLAQIRRYLTFIPSHWNRLLVVITSSCPELSYGVKMLI